ncbi:twin-arginine translocase subunit TatC [Celerinatantimonas diazotrophica]|uniref:Sec-independent protein translocase protein TatC n=1 Tax=Celerinatantimonas diazotrophica TaxID=412034 RepID=A0A4R1KIT3_9GAMM|nr:twin-arginine translocase subunit TatC [Celerinatantimonas diazotrophica]TCK63359.1 sec-independent protein translocase protein TatC [Celerinatantimonas diazotrophica]CAG9294903.1 Sec-independent protein translocase protein TatC [Celerinatantimonas diazotrophica]
MSHAPESESESAPLITHLLELRRRLLMCIVVVLVIFAALVYFSDTIYSWVAKPLLAVLPHHGTMIATGVAAPFLTPIKLTIVCSFFIAIPFILSQVWLFIAPGLYRREKQMVLPLVVASTVLFYAGMAFAYFVVFPLAFKFFTAVAPAGVTIATDISSYLNFVLKLFFAFGTAFEIPIATVLICWSGITSVQSLSAKRPYVIVAVFVIGMLLTPPDIFSQTLLALPMWFLFELGLFFARFYTRKNEAEETDSIDD